MTEVPEMVDEVVHDIHHLGINIMKWYGGVTAASCSILLQTKYQSCIWPTKSWDYLFVLSVHFIRPIFPARLGNDLISGFKWEESLQLEFISRVSSGHVEFPHTTSQSHILISIILLITQWLVIGVIQTNLNKPSQSFSWENIPSSSC